MLHLDPIDRNAMLARRVPGRHRADLGDVHRPTRGHPVVSHLHSERLRSDWWVHTVTGMVAGTLALEVGFLWWVRHVAALVGLR